MKPILFNTEMVRAILDGRKTQTRRVVRPQPSNSRFVMGYDQNENTYDFMCGNGGAGGIFIDWAETRKAPYKTGDVLWVRETFAKGCIAYGENSDGTPQPYISQCIGDVGFVPKEYALRHDIGVDDVVWRPSIHMPREAARIFLRATDVRVERVQEITEADARAEGCCTYHDKIGNGKFDDVLEFDLTSKDAFAELWNSTFKPADLPQYGWDANPWVWVIEFERCESKEG